MIKMATSISLLWLVLLVTQATQQTVDNCPSQLPRDQYLHSRGNICYQFVLNRRIVANDARKSCEMKGGMLVLVESPEVTKYLVDKLLNQFNFRDRIWIGLHDRESENKYFWEDGTPVGYSNWGRREGPSSGVHAIEDCVALDPTDGGKWHDYRCYAFTMDPLKIVYDYKAFVCQFQAIVSSTTIRISSTLTTAPATVAPTIASSTEEPTRPPPTISEPTYIPSTTVELISSSSITNSQNHEVSMSNEPTTAIATDSPDHTVLVSDESTLAGTNKLLSTIVTELSTNTAQTTEAKTSMSTPVSSTAKVTSETSTTTSQVTKVPTTSVSTSEIPINTSYTIAVTTNKTPSTEAPVTVTFSNPLATDISTACPPFECNLDCAMDGYLTDKLGCSICKCDGE